MEDAVAGERFGRFCYGCRETIGRSRPERPACKDWPAGAGDRFFSRRARSNRRCERKKMIDKTHKLPVIRQVKLLDLSRSSVYYLPQPTSDNDLLNRLRFFWTRIWGKTVSGKRSLKCRERRMQLGLRWGCRKEHVARLEATPARPLK